MQRAPLQLGDLTDAADLLKEAGRAAAAAAAAAGDDEGDKDGGAKRQVGLRTVN
jgi:hypothetical protein